jgi:hypothetical protein
MNTFALLSCIAVLLAVSYFFYCCAVTIGLWLRTKLGDRRSYSA